jgi:hypothetical protein
VSHGVFKASPRQRQSVEVLGSPGRRSHLARRSYGVCLKPFGIASASIGRHGGEGRRRIKQGKDDDGDVGGSGRAWRHGGGGPTARSGGGRQLRGEAGGAQIWEGGREGEREIAIGAMGGGERERGRERDSLGGLEWAWWARN